MARPRNILEPLELKKLISDTNARLVAEAKVKPDRRTLPHALLADGAGLYLRVQPSTRDLEQDPPSTSWVLRFMVDGKARTMGLGTYPKPVGLSRAREKADAAREQLDDAQDPIDHRKAERAARLAEQAKRLTFKEAATKLIASKRDGWRNAKHATQWENTLAQYVYPLIGDLYVADIDNSAVLRVLQQDVTVAKDKTERLWSARPETASRVRGRIEAVLAWATAGGLRTGANPADWTILKHQLPEKAKLARGKVKHHAAVPIDDVPGFLTQLRAIEGLSAKALQFVLLTAARSGEARGATWREIDLEAKLWTVPGARMKAGRDHRVPLSEPAVAILKELYEARISDDAFVFPSTTGGQLSDMALLMAMRRMGLEAVPHGLRSTFRDWGAERTNYPSEMLEMALAHTVSDKVEAAYRRGDMFAKRVQLMEAWANFCEGRSNVRPLAPAVEDAA